MILLPASDTLVAEPLKQLMKSNRDLMKKFAEKGFHWDPVGKLTLPIEASREAMAAAFSEGNFSEALAPVADALDRIYEAKDQFDRLAELIREAA